MAMAASSGDLTVQSIFVPTEVIADIFGHDDVAGQPWHFGFAITGVCISNT